MWIFSVGDSRGKITKHHKKADAPPPPAITQQIRFGNPPLLDLINRHSLMILFGKSVFHFRSIHMRLVNTLIYLYF